MKPSIAVRLKDFDDHMILKNFSSSTRVMYLRTLKSYLRYHQSKFKSKVLSQDTAREYILYRKKQGRSWPTINCDYSALRKYFREVIDKEWSLRKVPRPRKEVKLPRMLSKTDIVKLINAARTYKQQVFIYFVYSTGLRLSEALNITFGDIDRERLQIRVSRGKGSKDRIILIPECLMIVLTEYYKRSRPEKYLFNGLKKGNKYSVSAAQWIFRNAKTDRSITKPASVHTLRHAYATHHLEAGTDLVFLKQQLGHKHLKTTERYIHLCVERKRNIVHPISEIETAISWMVR